MLRLLECNYRSIAIASGMFKENMPCVDLSMHDVPLLRSAAPICMHGIAAVI
jgi:hypothetical protein